MVRSPSWNEGSWVKRGNYGASRLAGMLAHGFGRIGRKTLPRGSYFGSARTYLQPALWYQRTWTIRASGLSYPRCALTQSTVLNNQNFLSHEEIHYPGRGLPAVTRLYAGQRPQTNSCSWSIRRSYRMGAHPHCGLYRLAECEKATVKYLSTKTKPQRPG